MLLSRAFVGLLLLLATLRPALAETPALEAFFKRPAAREMQLSPSGRLLAFTAARDAGRVGLFVRDIASGRTRALVEFSDIDVVQPQWVDEDRLLFATADLGDSEAGSSTGFPGLYAVSVDGDRPRQLIQRRSWFAKEHSGGTRSEGALDIRHRLLMLPAGGGDEVLIGRYDGNAAKNLERVEPLWLNTRSGRTRHYDSGGAPDSVVNWLFDPQGQARAAITQNGDGVQLHWRGPGDEGWRQIAAADHELPFRAAFVDGLGNLFVLVPRGAGGEQVLTRFDLARGAPAEPAMVALPGYDFRGRLLFREDGAALGLRMLAERENTHWFGPEMRALQRQAEAKFPGRSVRIDCRRCGEPTMTALVFVDADRDPGQYWLYRADTGQWQGLLRLRPDIDAEAMASVEQHRIVARDGRPLPLWITRPTAASGPLPALVLVHGGPWSRGGYWRWDPLAQFLASRGYLVLQPEFRGSDGYGKTHLRAGDRQWGQAMQDDLVDALRWAQREGLASGQACILGASYGGYATLMGLIRHPQHYRCGAAWAAATDPFLLLKGSLWIEDDISGRGRQRNLPRWIGDAEADAEMLRQASPLLRAAEIKAPLLLAHGGKDLRVPIAHAERLRAALRAQGREPEWLHYEHEGHGWRELANQLDFARRLEGFFARHLGAASSAAAPPAQGPAH